MSYFDYWKCLISGGVSQTQSVYTEIIEWGGLSMTLELVIAVVTCVATVASTVIALLSFLKKKDKE